MVIKETHALHLGEGDTRRGQGENQSMQVLIVSANSSFTSKYVIIDNSENNSPARTTA